MKKQNENKLIFKKGSVTELNDHQLNHINGGVANPTIIATTWVCFGITLVTAAASYIIKELDND